MYHVTRCPNCRTSFRITDAHLSAFEGKVRCGRCAFVFNALEFLGGSAQPATNSPMPPTPAAPEAVTSEAVTAAAIASPTLVVQAPASEPLIAPVTIDVPDLALAQAAPLPLMPAEAQPDNGIDDQAESSDAHAAEDHAYGLDSVATQLGAAAEAERDGNEDDDSLATQSLQRLADALASERAGDIASAWPAPTLVESAPLSEPEPAAPAPIRDLRTAWQSAVPANAPPATASPAPVPAPEQDVPAEVVAEAQEEVIHIQGIDPWGSTAEMAAFRADVPEAETAAPAEILPADTGDATAETPPIDTAADFSPAPVLTDTGSHYRPILTHEDEALLRVPTRPSPLRWLWSIPAMLAGIVLLGQLAIHYRTEVAIQLPGIEPKLRRYCELVGCQLALPARAVYLRTEWNELVALPDSPNLIQLSATLRNHAGFAQALPLLELTLTDDNERIVARKVFTVREYLAPLADGSPAAVPASLLPNGDLRVFLQLDLGALRSSGYTLNWFYPQEN